MSGIGSIVFGPRPAPHGGRAWSLGAYGVGIKADQNARACNCIGPQYGQTKCPCALVGEAEQGRRMIQDGVTINGKRYKLVEVDA